MPDDLPHDFVLDIAKPYLGKFISDALGLDAAEALRQRLPTATTSPQLDPADPWQFKNFLVTEGD